MLSQKKPKIYDKINRKNFSCFSSVKFSLLCCFVILFEKTSCKVQCCKKFNISRLWNVLQTLWITYAPSSGSYLHATSLCNYRKSQRKLIFISFQFKLFKRSSSVIRALFSQWEASERKNDFANLKLFSRRFSAKLTLELLRNEKSKRKFNEILKLS